MNWWMLAGGAMALICATGHAVAGRGVFYRPIKADLRSELHAGVFTGMWHIITINFALSAIALVALSTRGDGKYSGVARRGPVCGLCYGLSHHIVASKCGLEAVSVDAFWGGCDSQRVRRH
jgi:hypothetical protein